MYRIRHVDSPLLYPAGSGTICVGTGRSGGQTASGVMVMREASKTGMSGYSTVLIAAGDGYLRDALRAMMISMPDVMILEASDTLQAGAMLREHRPDLVIIDSALPGNHTMQLVDTIQHFSPRPRCSILVDSILQQAAALRAGADRAPLKGEPPPKLFAQVEQLLWPSQVRQAAA